MNTKDDNVNGLSKSKYFSKYQSRNSLVKFGLKYCETPCIHSAHLSVKYLCLSLNVVDWLMSGALRLFNSSA